MPLGDSIIKARLWKRKSESNNKILNYKKVT